MHENTVTISEASYDYMNHVIASQKQRIEELEYALQFYTDMNNWKINSRLDGNSSNFDGGPAKEVLNKK